eukprot:scaffold130964_cov33-Prasinocladus_malaysianus.AAC.1
MSLTVPEHGSQCNAHQADNTDMKKGLTSCSCYECTSLITFAFETKVLGVSTSLKAVEKAKVYSIVEQNHTFTQCHSDSYLTDEQPIGKHFTNHTLRQ